MMAERVLLEVHLEAAKAWTTHLNWYNKLAAALVQRIADAEPTYDRVIQFEYDPWEPLCRPISTSYTYQDVANLIGMESDVDVAGVQRDFCVRKVVEELNSLGIKIHIREDLTMDLEDYRAH